jgi:hypothetical protein
MRRYKRPAVQLTSLLDLLFVMVFLSLLQTKTTPTAPEPAVAATPEVRPKEVKVPKPRPAPVPAPISAVFHFYATARNPDVPTGTFAMHGKYKDEAGELELYGVSWINRPSENVDMVPLKGRVEGKFLRGRVDHQGCAEFVLTRTSTNAGSSLAGKWEGRYVCAQGETGLTLTIQ